MDKFIIFQSERGIYISFCNLFKTQYVRYLNANNKPSNGKSEITTVLQSFKKAQDLLESNSEGKSKYFLIIPAFLSLLI